MLLQLTRLTSLKLLSAGTLGIRLVGHMAEDILESDEEDNGTVASSSMISLPGLPFLKTGGFFGKCREGILMFLDVLVN